VRVWTQERAEEALQEAAIACGLADDDGLESVEATIASGMTAGMVNPRAVPEREGPDGEIRSVSRPIGRARLTEVNLNRKQQTTSTGTQQTTSTGTRQTTSTGMSSGTKNCARWFWRELSVSMISRDESMS
jgi:hypothetical protein